MFFRQIQDCITSCSIIEQERSTIRSSGSCLQIDLGRTWSQRSGRTKTSLKNLCCSARRAHNWVPAKLEKIYWKTAQILPRLIFLNRSWQELLFSKALLLPLYGNKHWHKITSVFFQSIFQIEASLKWRVKGRLKVGGLQAEVCPKVRKLSTSKKVKTQIMNRFVFLSRLGYWKYDS